MKRFVVFVLLFGFVIARDLAAEESSNQNNSTPSKGSSAPPRASAPAKPTAHPPRVANTVRNPAVVAGKPQVRNQPYSYYRRNYPRGVQPLHRDLAMNIDRGARTNPPQITNLAHPGSASRSDSRQTHTCWQEKSATRQQQQQQQQRQQQSQQLRGRTEALPA